MTYDEEKAAHIETLKAMLPEPGHRGPLLEAMMAVAMDAVIENAEGDITHAQNEFRRLVQVAALPRLFTRFALAYLFEGVCGTIKGSDMHGIAEWRRDRERKGLPDLRKAK